MNAYPPDLEHACRCSSNRYEAWVASCIVGLCISLGIHEFTRIDFVLQDLFYNAATDRWWVDQDAPLPRWTFYLIPKWLTISTIIVLGGWMISDRVRGIHDTLGGRSRWLVFVSLITIPAAVGLFKKNSGVWCPSELTRYSGDQTFRLLFEVRPPGVEVGHCFPSGHASAGFAFLCLCFLPGSSKQKLFRFMLVMALGWSMGLYQMFKGAHFLSHNLTTMFLAGLITATVAWLVPLSGQENPTTTGEPSPPPTQPASAICRPNPTSRIEPDNTSKTPTQ